MKENPEISIIVPVYKTEKYLRQCINSILAQTFTNYEVILVEDGSPDNCSAICDAYAEKDNRICVIHQENHGVSVARNVGIELSRGHFICFVDGDDLLSPFFCQIMIDSLRFTSCDYAAARIRRFTDEDKEIKRGEIPEPIITIQSSTQYLEQQFSQGFSVCGKMFRRTVFRSLSFYSQKRHEDIIFPADLARTQKNGVCCINLELYYYRQHEGGFMSQSKRHCSPDRVFAGEYLYQTVKDIAPDLCDKAFVYAVSYPWSYVDRVFVDRSFRVDGDFLRELKVFLKTNVDAIDSCFMLDPIIKRRMKLFTKGFFFYGINAYARLFRVYFFHLIKKDAYTDGHGI